MNGRAADHRWEPSRGTQVDIARTDAMCDVFQCRQVDVRPGITGWAQVNSRNSTSWTERIRLDVWYIDHWTLWLDVRILPMTTGRMLRQCSVEGEQPSCETA
jgi:lipopolysaccharide/colanic/teichoic acid biosynthesis glycosyltransferase